MQGHVSDKCVYYCCTSVCVCHSNHGTPTLLLSLSLTWTLRYVNCFLPASFIPHLCLSWMLDIERKSSASGNKLEKDYDDKESTQKAERLGSVRFCDSRQVSPHPWGDSRNYCSRAPSSSRLLLFSNPAHLLNLNRSQQACLSAWRTLSCLSPGFQLQLQRNNEKKGEESDFYSMYAKKGEKKERKWEEKRGHETKEGAKMRGRTRLIKKKKGEGIKEVTTKTKYDRGGSAEEREQRDVVPCCWKQHW